MVATATIGYASVNLLPLVLGSLIDTWGLDATSAGLVGTLELAGLAATSLALAGPLSRGPRRSWALVGAGIALLGNGASALVDAFAPLAATRLMAGLGEGMVLAAGNAAAAAAFDPERLFARVSLLSGLYFGGALVGLPYVTGPFGPGGGFAVIALTILVCTPWTRGLPPAPARERGVDARRAAHRAAALLALLAILVLNAGQSGLWVFSERLGVRAGLSSEAVGAVLGVSTLLGLGGAALAAVLGTRYGRFRPLVVGISTYLACGLILVGVPREIPFIAANVAWGVAFFFTLPYLLGTLAALDRRGVWTVAATAALGVGSALGPVLTGALMARGWSWVGWFVAISAPVALALFLPAIRAADGAEPSNGALTEPVS